MLLIGDRACGVLSEAFASPTLLLNIVLWFA